MPTQNCSTLTSWAKIFTESRIERLQSGQRLSPADRRIKSKIVNHQSNMELKPWQKIASKTVGDFRIFKIRADEKISPRTGQHCDFFVIESVNWVNVVA